MQLVQRTRRRDNGARRVGSALASFAAKAFVGDGNRARPWLGPPDSAAQVAVCARIWRLSAGTCFALGVNKRRHGSGADHT